jgi:hypothetical protein
MISSSGGEAAFDTLRQSKKLHDIIPTIFGVKVIWPPSVTGKYIHLCFEYSLPEESANLGIALVFLHKTQVKTVAEDESREFTSRSVASQRLQCTEAPCAEESMFRNVISFISQGP